MMSTEHILRRISSFAPLITMLGLLGLAYWLPNHVAITEETVELQQRIAGAMENLPYEIGRDDTWFGKAAEVPREAQELLRPNAILSREYRRLNGMSLHLLVVHCSDARDMQGHYPPACYPSSGWVPIAVDGETDFELTVDECRLAVRTYCFQMVHKDNSVNRIRIFNTFILPGGAVTREKADLSRQTERLAVSVQGVAQMQIISGMNLSYDESVAAASDLLGGMPALFEALSVDCEQGSRE